MADVLASISLSFEQTPMGKLTVDSKIMIDSVIPVNLNTDKTDRRGVACLQSSFCDELENRLTIQIRKREYNAGSVIIIITDTIRFPPIEIISLRLLPPHDNSLSRQIENSNIKHHAAIKDKKIGFNSISHEIRQKEDGSKTSEDDIINAYQLWRKGLDLLDIMWTRLLKEASLHETGTILERYFDDEVVEHMGPYAAHAFEKVVRRITLPSWQSLLSPLSPYLDKQKNVESDSPLTDDSKEVSSSLIYAMSKSSDVASQPVCSTTQKLGSFLYPDAPTTSISVTSQVPKLVSGIGSMELTRKDKRTSTAESLANWKHPVMESPILCVWQIGGERYRKVFLPTDKVSFTNELPGGLCCPKSSLHLWDATVKYPQIPPLLTANLGQSLIGLNLRGVVPSGPVAGASKYIVIKLFTSFMEDFTDVLALLVEWHIRLESLTCTTQKEDFGQSSPGNLWTRELEKVVGKDKVWPSTVEIDVKNRDIKNRKNNMPGIKSGNALIKKSLVLDGYGVLEYILLRWDMMFRDFHIQKHIDYKGTQKSQEAGAMDFDRLPALYWKFVDFWYNKNIFSKADDKFLEFEKFLCSGSEKSSCFEQFSVMAVCITDALHFRRTAARMKTSVIPIWSGLNIGPLASWYMKQHSDIPTILLSHDVQYYRTY